jgi:MFS family permease
VIVLIETSFNGEFSQTAGNYTGNLPFTVFSSSVEASRASPIGDLFIRAMSGQSTASRARRRSLCYPAREKINTLELPSNARPRHGNLAEPRPQARFLTTLLLLWLAGTGLRLTILAVPPVIPLIHDGLKLNATQIGILTGLPSMLFAFAAVPGSLLIALLGVRTALVVGLAITAIGGALRGAISDVMWLYAMTAAMGAGVAVMQVTMPPAVRNWIPQRIGFATAVYTNGLLVGEILPVALMLPLVLPMVGGSWQWGFVVWSVPVVVIAALIWRWRRPSVRLRTQAAAGGPTGTVTLSGGSASCSAPSTPIISPPTRSCLTICGAMAKASGSAPRFPA